MDMDEALERCLHYFDNRADSIDGDYGAPEPNEEMRLYCLLKDAIEEENAMKHVSVNGVIYQMTDNKYKYFVGQMRAQRQIPDINRFGKLANIKVVAVDEILRKVLSEGTGDHVFLGKRHD